MRGALAGRISALTTFGAYAARRLNKPSVVSLRGVSLFVGNGPATSARNLIYSGAYEAAEIDVISRELQKDDIVLEIGAGLGFISTYCAKSIGSDRVHAFEANPELEQAIRETYDLNGVSPQFTCAAVANGPSQPVLHAHADFFSSSMVKRPGSRQALEVEAVEFGVLLSDLSPTFLVVDVEGYETELFCGVDLLSVKKLCLEMHPHVVGDAACSAVLASLLGQGFQLVLDRCRGRVLFFSKEEPASGAFLAGVEAD